MEQAEILRAISEDRAEYTLVPLQVGPLVIYVTADAVRIDGVRVAVSHATAKEAARLLGCKLTTPRIEDLIHKAAKWQAIPVTFGPPRAAWKTIRDHSHAVESQLPSNRAPDDLVSTVGKSWVQTKAGGTKNYGWHGGPYAKSRAVTPGLMVVQSVGGAHGATHYDYSQTLRLVSSRCLVDDTDRDIDTVLRDPELGGWLAHDAPWGTLPHAIPVMDLSEPVGVRCVRVARLEAEQHNPPSAADVARYFEHCERNGRRLGISKGNHCAGFASWNGLQCIAPDEALPHLPRAAAKELMADAIESHAWHEVSECTEGAWHPAIGDLAIYDRYDPSNPRSQPWHGHVDRVTELDLDGRRYRNLGANEVGNWTGRGGFREQWTDFAHPRLMGFVAYPTPPKTPDPAPPVHLLTERDVAQVRALVALTTAAAEADYFDYWRRERDRRARDE
jgi:hypothetical protein